VNASASQKIISFIPSSKAEVIRQIEKAGGKVTKEFHIINAIVAVFPDIDTKSAQLNYLEGVTRITEDREIKLIDDIPEQFPFAENKNLGRNKLVAQEKQEKDVIVWGVARVNAPSAWNVTMGDGVKVAILDTGIDYTHPDLAAHYAGGYNTFNPGGPPLDDQGHGTHVAGIIGAVRDGKGVVGVAPNVSLYAVKVIDRNDHGTYATIIDGLEWAVDNKMQVINMSLNGGSGTPELASAIKAAYEAGITIVCSAGNGSGPVETPARYPEVIAVSSSDSSNKIASDSARGPEIDFIAPGVNVGSTYVGGYRILSGTSQATAHVTGLVALAIAAGANAPDVVKAALKNAASPIGLQPTEEGAGMIDAVKLVKNLTH
jgi:subtilisin